MLHLFLCHSVVDVDAQQYTSTARVLRAARSCGRLAVHSFRYPWPFCRFCSFECGIIQCAISSIPVISVRQSRPRCPIQCSHCKKTSIMRGVDGVFPEYSLICMLLLPFSAQGARTLQPLIRQAFDVRGICAPRES